jgi:hypothetical protein
MAETAVSAMSEPMAEIGRLSPAEREGLPIGPARRHYETTLGVATRARDELRQAIAGEPIVRAHLARLANAYAWASRALYLAAQGLCDLEDLDDDGSAEGIKWELPV